MLKRITIQAIKARYLIMIGAVILMMAGLNTAQKTPMDVFPEFAPVKVEVQTEGPGLSSIEIEQLISIPIERAFSGIPNVKTIRSKSVLGLSSVVLLFAEGAEMAEARQAVQERLLIVSSTLPKFVKQPTMMPRLSSLSRILKIGLSSDSHSIEQLSTSALWTIRPRLMAIAGVANVALWGLRDPELHVKFDTRKLTQHNLTSLQVSQQLSAFITPNAGGYLDTAQQRFAITQDSPSTDITAYEQLTVGYNIAIPIKLNQVADVVWGHAIAIGDAVINQGDGLLLIVEKTPGANTLSVTKDIEAALEELKPALSGITVDASIFRPATFIEKALQNLQHALWLGAGLVVIILFIFLRNPKAAAISLISIPLSLTTAILLLTWLNVSVNTMVLAGLVIALGEVVDDLIIDLENILRAIYENRLLQQPKALIKVIAQASYEVRGAVLNATLIVMAVFMPIFFLEGVAGAFFKPLAYGYLLAIFSSLLVALIVTPTLAFVFLKHEEEESSGANRLQVSILSFIKRAIFRARTTIAVAVSLMVVSLCIVPWLGSEFLPAFKETDFLMHFIERPGTSIEQMKKTNLLASEQLMQVDGVLNLGAHIGRAELADEVVGPNFGELWVSIDPKADYQKTIQQIQQSIAGFAGIFTDVQTYLKERTKEVMSGSSASIVIRLFGSDVDRLRTQAERIRQTIQGVNGLTDLKVESQALIPQIHVKLKTNVADQYGITESDVKRMLTLMTLGEKVGEIYIGQERFNVQLIGEDKVQGSIQALRQMQIQSVSGALVPLAEVAQVYVQPVQNEVKREAGSRKIDVMANASGRDLGTVAKEVEQLVGQMQLPEGYYVQFMGEYTEQKSATRTLLTYTLLALVLVFALIFMSLQSLKLTLILFAILPIALAGGIFGIVLSGGVISLGSLVGLIAVLGIASRNGILLISRYTQLKAQQSVSHYDAIYTAVSDRLRPIMMTTLATSMALMPIVFKGPISGYEIEHPLAVVVVCGLLLSSIVSLVVLPAIIYRYDAQFKGI